MSRFGYPVLAFLTGTAVTVFEFAAPNLFRAYFGQTIFVWANVIGVILAVLALGYAVGGRWADRTKTALPLFVILAAAGAYGVLIGIFGPSVSAWLAGPEEYTQDAAIPAFLVESLAASLILFGPPLFFLAMATPMMVQRASAHWPVGRAAGLLFGVSTIGSVLGIYLTTYVLLDSFGVRATISGAGAALLLLAAFGLRRVRPASAACLLGALALPLGVRPPWDSLPPPGSRTRLAIESPYQLIRVVDRPAAEGGRRWLSFDEGMGTYHSMSIPEGERWTGAYYDAFATLPEWVGGRKPLRICILGNAAGTMSRLLHLHHDPADFRIDGVEIDPRVTEAARREMGLRDADHPSLRLVHGDGRTFLSTRAEGTYDAIVLDAYARQVSIPPALATREFFALTRSRLREGGVLFVNLGALRPGGRLVRALADTLVAGFGSPVFRAPLAGQQNVLLVAARGGPPPPPPESTPLGVPESFGLHVPGSDVLTDDHCPVERLTARDLLGAALGLLPLSLAAEKAPAEVREAQRTRGYLAAIALLQPRIADWHDADAFARLCAWAGEEERGLQALRGAPIPQAQRSWSRADLLLLLGRFPEAIAEGRTAGKGQDWIDWAEGQSAIRARLQGRGSRAILVAAGAAAGVLALGAALFRLAPPTAPS